MSAACKTLDQLRNSLQSDSPPSEESYANNQKVAVIKYKDDKTEKVEEAVVSVWSSVFINCENTRTYCLRGLTHQG